MYQAIISQNTKSSIKYNHQPDKLKYSRNHGGLSPLLHQQQLIERIIRHTPLHNLKTFMLLLQIKELQNL